jgi:hypothetical protein
VLQILTAEHALRVDRLLTDVKIISRGANSSQLQLSPENAVRIGLAADIKEIFVADSGIDSHRTIRRIYITSVAVSKTNVF